MSTPTSATKLQAVTRSTPGIVCQSVTAGSKGRICLSISASRRAILLSTAAVFGVQAPPLQPEARAREALDRLLAGDAAGLHALFDDRMKKALPVDVIEKQVMPQVRAWGEVKNIGEPRVESAGEISVVRIPLQLTARSLNLQVNVDRAGAVAGLFFRAADPPKVNWQRPPYSKPEAFTERRFGSAMASGRSPARSPCLRRRARFPA
jgi:hypothetical protein